MGKYRGVAGMCAMGYDPWGHEGSWYAFQKDYKDFTAMRHCQ